jgi:NodT family efflux transporter outer membrane factor (OMF) lipoprotein
MKLFFKNCKRQIVRIWSIKKSFVIVIIGVLNVACSAVGPDYVAPQLSSPIKWNGEIGSQLNTNPLDPKVLNQWWETLQDPVLTDLIERSIMGNLSLRDAQARILEARALRGVSRADRFPTLNASGSVSRNRISENSFYQGTRYAGSTNTLYDGGFDAGWEIDLFGKVQRSVEVTQANLEASEESYRDVLVTLEAEVALNYVEVCTQQARLSVAQKHRDSQAEIVALVRSSVTAGETARLDLEQAQANLETTRSTIPRLEILLSQAKNRLAVLLGLPPGVLADELSDQRAIPLAPAQVAVGVPADVLRRRPDVRRAERALAVASARIGVATADLYPSLTLFGSVGLESLASGDFLNSASSVFGVGPSLQWNLFDSGRIRNNIEITNAQQEQALIAYEAAVLRALQDVENSIVAYGQEMIRRRALVNAERSAHRALLIAQDLYKAGESDFIRVLDTQRSLLKLQDQLAASNGQVTTNIISLFKALGGGWTPIEPQAL